MLHVQFHQERQREWKRELNRKLELSRQLAEAPVARSIPKPLTLSVRAAEDAGLVRLAELNEAPAPTGPHVVASIDGEVVAARGLENERVLTDPFRRTAHLVRLLALHARGVMADSRT